MTSRERLAAIWPIYGLRIRTSRLELKLPTESEIANLADVAAGGIRQPGEPPFQASWFYEPSPTVERKLLQFAFGLVANWDPDDWDLGLAVFIGGKPIGMQNIYAKHFNTTRVFGASSWLGRAYQGRGVGTEMGRAILSLGFAGLGAREAYSGAWADNAASLRVMEKLGYLPNGQYYQPSGDEARLDRRMRLPREIWARTQPDDIEIEGLATCLELFGAA